MASSKRWQLYNQAPQLAKNISSALNVSTVVAQLLLNRGITNLNHAKHFLEKNSFQAPYFDKSSLESCSKLIRDCITANKPILLYGDYDVDGMTSIAIMYEALLACQAKVHYVIPDRFEHGYGLHLSVIDTIKTYDVGLLITLDCGVSNVAEITKIKATTHCPVIVFDHHQLPDTLPPFNAMLNPKTLLDKHPASELCTAGIAYAFIHYFFSTFYKNLDPCIFLDLVALGTIADVANLKGLNRTWTAIGLKILAKRNRLGIDALLHCAEFKHSMVSVRDVGFVIAPRLNAGGRLASAQLGVQLLTAKDKQTAKRLAQKLEHLNLERRNIGQNMLTEAIELADKECAADKVTIVGKPDWHPGVIGITAARLVEHFSKPAILMSKHDDHWRGSARSCGDIHLYKLLKQCQNHFENFGGHKQAAGFTVKDHSLQNFKTQLQVEAMKLDNKLFLPIIDIDMKLSFEQLTQTLAEELTCLEPFGQGNPAPIFFCDELITLAAKPVGNGQHIKATLKHMKSSFTIDAIGFYLSEKIDIFYKQPLSIIFQLSINKWQGKSLPQLEIIDLK